MTEDTIDINPHFPFSEKLNQLHIGVAHCVHEGIPVVGGVKLVDEMWVIGEKFDDLLGIAFL
jgi:hypothetical protein